MLKALIGILDSTISSAMVPVRPSPAVDGAAFYLEICYYSLFQCFSIDVNVLDWDCD